ncbi:glycosyltransferase family 2 protein [Ferdinandcohnia quinoae]|uniref:Glycosyltransferase n=1 Tax=Fredinandcohnia quinoae TaxID=2918902 RepID=A0AAW5E298_9BACI|nr:glycosyltransferase family 2 protein [Fredinandcohnia sp. SECRCQ15]MCH1624889.1 glycosyltransferase [Fredinandcohnia sp. SECRCQ15]
MSKKVSIIMGIYNCEATIPQAIESILSQTYINWQLIMCDDCSTDNTHQIAKEYRDKYPEKILLIQNDKNLGLASSLNHCLKYVEGEYVARMDADDISMPNRLEKQVNFLENHLDCDLIGTGLIPFDDKGDRSPRIGIENPSKFTLLTNSPFSHATIMVRRKVYDALGGYTILKRTIRAEDLDLWFRFYEAGFSGNVLQEGLYKVREDLNCFKRRKMIYRIHEMQIRLLGYKLLKFPLRYYPMALRPIIIGLIPSHFIYAYKSTIK